MRREWHQQTVSTMDTAKAWDILVSYCIGNFKYTTADTVHALSWALHQIDPEQLSLKEQNYEKSNLTKLH